MKLFSILLFFLLVPFAAMCGSDVRARFSKTLQDAKSLTNFDLVWLDSMRTPDPNLPDPSISNAPSYRRTIQYSYLSAGPRYRAEYKLIDASQTNVIKSWVSAYDGSSYLSYRGDDHYLVIGSNVLSLDCAQSSQSPLVAPFLFFLPYSDSCRGCVLRFRDLLSRASTYQLDTSVKEGSNGVIEFALAGLQNGGQKSTWNISMPSDGDSFSPSTITFLVPGLRWQMAFKLSDYTNVGNYPVPGKIEYTMNQLAGTSPTRLITKGTVTLVSARIPDTIDDSAFRLDSEKASAKVIWDYNRNVLVKEGPAALRYHTIHGRTKTLLISLLLISVVGIPVGIFAAERFFRRSRQR